MTFSHRRTLVIYLSAAAGILLATAIRSALDPVLGEHLMFSMYFLAVSIAAWAGGVRPAMVTAILSSIVANLLFSAPRGTLQIDTAEELCALILFMSVSLLIGVLSEISLSSLARARAAEQHKDDFLAILAHELRNPLAIIHYTNLADRSGQPDGESRTEVIDRQVQQLDQMIEDLLDVARVSRGKFHLECEPVSVLSVVDEAVDKSRHTIDERELDLTVQRPAENLILWADPLRLEQILINLLRNAARYTSRGGEILLQVSAEGDFAVFRVRDNGQGIPKELLSRIFDLRTQVDRSLESSGTPMAAGLALVRTLVDLHGGTITATSEGPQRGSEFIVRLPLFHEQPKERSQRVREAS